MKTATVSDLVTDSSGAVVLGAEVQLQSLDRGTVKTRKDGRGVSRAPLPPHSLKSTGGSPRALFKQHELPANRRCFRLPTTSGWPQSTPLAPPANRTRPAPRRTH